MSVSGEVVEKDPAGSEASYSFVKGSLQNGVKRPLSGASSSRSCAVRVRPVS
jgi:hypothetical protein